MVVSEVVTLFFYVISIAFLPAYFGMHPFCLAVCSIRIDDCLLADLSFVVTPTFAWKVAVIVAISALPLYIFKLIKRKIAPAASSKLL
jgi:phospholipid-translocating ATPase